MEKIMTGKISPCEISRKLELNGWDVDSIQDENIGLIELSNSTANVIISSMYKVEEDEFEIVLESEEEYFETVANYFVSGGYELMA